MRRFPCIVPAVLSLASLMAASQQPTMTEAQCRQMTDTMVLQMKSSIAPSGGMSEKDRQGARALIERIEKLVFDNRSKSVRECETWGRVAKIIATQ